MSLCNDRAYIVLVIVKADAVVTLLFCVFRAEVTGTDASGASITDDEGKCHITLSACV